GFVDYVWYRRNFSNPKDWKGKRVLLHIGACDWETTVWINGGEVGFHRGGNGQFSFDITDHLIDGENTVVIRAFDDVRSGLQTAGKQSQREESHGIFYTRTTGIWQTVWLEAVSDTYIKKFSVTPDIHQGMFFIEANLEGEDQGMTLSAEAFLDGQSVGKGEAETQWRNTRVHVPLSEKILWTVETPTLYSIKLLLKKGDKTVDEVETYAGLREVDIQGRAILLNGKPVFQRLVLDQGFYPEGVWTAPTDEALARDIELSKSVGFNGARLHQKVFEPRFLYHADRL
ncbi:MAG: beta-galactosidase, partial [Candidatus Omnitrophica bacterium]|nr:beta-galactosidase [Candidatus Omnitrophota bacterium]